MDKSKLRPLMKFLEKTGLIYQISLEDFHGGLLSLCCSLVPFYSLIGESEMREYGENTSYEYLTSALLLIS